MTSPIRSQIDRGLGMRTESEWSEMRERYRQGMSISQIARDEGLSRNTVKKYVHAEVPPSYARSSTRESKLDPSKPYIRQRLKEYPISAARLFDRLLAGFREGPYRADVSTFPGCHFSQGFYRARGQKPLNRETATLDYGSKVLNEHTRSRIRTSMNSYRWSRGRLILLQRTTKLLEISARRGNPPPHTK